MTLIQNLVPMAHVADVEDSIGFYTSHLGFSVRNRLEHGGRTFWAWLDSGSASLMLSAASAPVDPEQQAVLFYLYADDVAGLREKLLAEGLAEGEAYKGGNPPGSGGRRLVYRITHPHYMPKGELRIADPDGYVLLVGQTG
jgi:catechol 2,3-dioxygenase-like lactoylglutathione lyase family enzyme